ncbi:MAG: thiol-disulfide oxidoreductase DCC [Acidobacteria bacterium]|nr:MAG: thiol-disulfide oxidoreductase DCC [Acidobacteriota bacterium]
MDTNRQTSIILFDGVCNLCNNSVNFIISRDPHKHFKFAALQSLAGQRLLQENDLHPRQLETFILIEEGQVYSRSSAALQVAKRLNKPWPLLYVCKLMPVPIRDRIYNLVAKHRYRLFGKRETCMVPTSDVKERFIS